MSLGLKLQMVRIDSSEKLRSLAGLQVVLLTEDNYMVVGLVELVGCFWAGDWTVVWKSLCLRKVEVACEERGTGGEPVSLKLDCLLREGHRRV
jgi:hypothetical protein